VRHPEGLTIERLERHFMPEPNTGCWLWIGARNWRGYGQIGAGNGSGRTLMAHRAAYVLARGPIPEGMDIDHLCRVRACVNPAHLEAVTHLVNVQRGKAGCRPTCPRGHAYDIYPGGRRRCRTCTRDHNSRRPSRATKGVLP